MTASVAREPRLKDSPAIPSLNGLRAVSILLVLIGHGNRTAGAGSLHLGIGDEARLGVVAFFVISGFLITSLLMAEHAAAGTISLRRFYIRRALRIFPASYAYIACIFSLSLMSFVTASQSDFWHAVSYTVNFAPQRSWEIGHLWSLSVEEQFYLLWPFAFVGLGLQRSRWAAAATIVIGPLARVANTLFLRGTPYHDLEMFPMIADSLAVGCLLAALRPWLETQRWYLALFRPGWSLLLVGVVLGANRYSVYTAGAVVGGSAINLCLGVLVHRSVYCWKDSVGRILNWKPLEFVGLLSYSLYLWQQLFLDRRSAAWHNAFPQNLMFTIVAALASYLLLERPLLKLRHRFRAYAA